MRRFQGIVLGFLEVLLLFLLGLIFFGIGSRHCAREQHLTHAVAEE